MNRTALSINMLLLLKTRGKMKKKEIADALETNQRNIIEFKRELETAGYCIGYENGRYGGYFLMDRAILPVSNLTVNEKNALKRFDEYTDYNKDFLLYKDLKSALLKTIVANEVMNENYEVLQVVKKFPLAKDPKELQDIYLKVHTAIINRQKLKIIYHSFSSENKNERVIHPYEMFQYNDSWYMVGRQEESEELRSFKLARISEIDIMDRKFLVDKNFDISDYINDFGIEIKGQTQRIKLKIFKPYISVVSEIIIGENQLITNHGDHIELEVTIKGDFIVKQFILGMGSGCEVLEPLALRESMIQEINRTRGIYSDDVIDKNTLEI
ncbi:MAG: WYL domain-containing protein [Clostridiales bacterium]|nr:WYL domain-containing protein [Clostridiales bacterium]